MKEKSSSFKKRIILVSIVSIILIALVVSITVASSNSEKSNIFGDDSKIDFFVMANNDGLNADGSKQKPFNSIDDAVSHIKGIEESPTGATTKNYVVAIRGGKYGKTVIKDYNLDNKISFINYDDEEVVFSLMQQLDSSKFTSLNNSEKARLSQAAEDKVYKLDLASYNFTADQLGKIYTKGQYLNDKTDPLYNANRIAQSNLYVNDVLQNLARYPNDGATLQVGVVSKNSTTTKYGYGATFGIDDTSAARVKSWQSIDNVWIYGYFAKDWADSSTSIEGFDKNTNKITTSYGHNYGYVKAGNFLFENVFEELDCDNEWYLDNTNNMLYLFSESGVSGKKIELSVGNDVILAVNSCKNISFEGISFSGSRKHGIEINNSRDINVKNCQIKCFSKDSVYIKSSKNVTIDNNDVFSIGEQGIVIAPKTDVFEFQNIAISNNDIHDFGQIKRVYSAAINVSGIGNIINNNKIYNAPHLALSLSGNCNLIQNNEIFNVCTDSGDAGAIYMGRTFSCYGNIIKSNFIHDIQYQFFNGTTTRFYKPSAIYLDDFVSGQTVVDNIIANVGGQYVVPDGSGRTAESGNGIFVNGGRDNTIEGNILLGARFEYRSTAKLEYDKGNPYYTDIENIAYPNAAKGEFFRIVKEGKALNAKWGNVFARVSNLSTDNQDYLLPSFAVNPASQVKNNVMIYAFDKRAALLLSSDLSVFGVNQSNVAVKIKETEGKYGLKLDISQVGNIEYVRQYVLLMIDKHNFLSPTNVLNSRIDPSDCSKELEYKVS